VFSIKILVLNGCKFILFYLLSFGFCFLLWLFLVTNVVVWFPLPLKTSIFVSLIVALFGMSLFDSKKIGRLLAVFFSIFFIGIIIFYYLVASSL
jgi:hypothetical protein